jgi:hypothetical protein
MQGDRNHMIWRWLCAAVLGFMLAVSASAQEPLTWLCRTSIAENVHIDRILREDGAWEQQEEWPYWEGDKGAPPLKDSVVAEPGFPRLYATLKWGAVPDGGKAPVPLVELKFDESFPSATQLILSPGEASHPAARPLSRLVSDARETFLIGAAALAASFTGSARINVHLKTPEGYYRKSGQRAVIDLVAFRALLPKLAEADARLDAMQADRTRQCTGSARTDFEARALGVPFSLADDGYNDCPAEQKFSWGMATANVNGIWARLRVGGGWSLSLSPRLKGALALSGEEQLPDYKIAAHLVKFAESGLAAAPFETHIDLRKYGEPWSGRYVHENPRWYRLVAEKAGERVELTQSKPIDWATLAALDAKDGPVVLFFNRHDGKTLKSIEMPQGAFRQAEWAMQLAYREVIRKRMNARALCTKPPEEIMVTLGNQE